MSGNVAAHCRRLVAGYLRSNGYDKTLDAFHAEAQAEQQPESDAQGEATLSSFDLRHLVELWLEQQSLTERLGRTSLDYVASSSSSINRNRTAFDWHKQVSLQQIPHRISHTLRDVHLSSVLSVAHCCLPRRIFDTSTAEYSSSRVDCIVTSSTDKRIVFTRTDDWTTEDAFEPSRSVTLSVKMNPVYPWLMLSGAMDGSITVTDVLTRGSKSLKEHTKYVVRVAWSADGLWFCSLGYDRTICLYEVRAFPPAGSSSAQLVDQGDEFASLPTFEYACRWRRTLPSNPEAAVFLPGSDYLAFTRRDDNQLHYVKLPAHGSPDAAFEEIPITSYNLNENLDSHISFCILSLAIHPSGEAITLQTDTSIARIIILPFHSSKRIRETLYTNAEQSPFSNPRHAWFSHGTGCVVSSDDGILRIVDLNGKVKASIPAHGIAAPLEDDNVEISREILRARYESDRGSSVIRDLCILPDNTIVSCGLDKTVRVCQV